MKWVLWCWAASGELGLLADMILVGKTMFACKLAKPYIPVQQTETNPGATSHTFYAAGTRLCRMQHGVCNIPWSFLPHVGKLLSRKADIAFASPMRALANLPV